MTEAELRGQFPAARELAYLDSATFGLPPLPTVEALERALADWQSGQADWLAWERDAEICRSHFATLTGGSAADIALMPAVSVATALAFSSVPDGGEILVAEGDFRSVVFPALALERARRVQVREAPFEGLAEAVTDRTDLVAVSHVHSRDGSVADLEAIRDAARSTRARLLVDATQSLGVVPLDVNELEVDYLACAAYKWLCCPRGVAFLYVRGSLLESTVPLTASWRGALGAPDSGYYGGPLELRPDAGLFDVSIAWHAWVGARRSLDVLLSIDDATRWQMASEPAREFARLLGLSEPKSSIVSVPVADGEAALTAIRGAGIRASGRSGRIRISTHVYNTVDQVRHAAAVLQPFVVAE